MNNNIDSSKINVIKFEDRDYTELNKVGIVYCGDMFCYLREPIYSFFKRIFSKLLFWG